MKAKIAVLAGDGVGREIVPEAVKVLKVVAEKFQHTFEFLSGTEVRGAIELLRRMLGQSLQVGHGWDDATAVYLAGV